jgi:hypothetical protein
MSASFGYQLTYSCNKAPTMRHSHPLLDVIDLWLPEQRPIGEEPEVLAQCMGAQEVVNDRIVILLSVVDDIGVWTRVLQHTMDLRYKAGRESQLAGSHQITPNRYNGAAR